jgi:Asp-tRNA(Asn)/Glu-tRNA(Gln) amidotransferase A subunit family amidase
VSNEELCFKSLHDRAEAIRKGAVTLRFDHVGPLTRTARNAGLVLQAIARYEPTDAMSRNASVHDFTSAIGKGVHGMRLALCPDFYNHSEVYTACKEEADVCLPPSYITLAWNVP